MATKRSVPDASLRNIGVGDSGSHSWMCKQVSYCTYLANDSQTKNFVKFANRAWLQVLDYTLVYICIDVYSMYVKNPNPCCIYMYAWCHTKPSLIVVCFQKNPTLWSPHGPCHEASWANAMKPRGPWKPQHLLGLSFPMQDLPSLTGRRWVVHLMNNTMSLVHCHGSGTDHTSMYVVICYSKLAESAAF